MATAIGPTLPLLPTEVLFSIFKLLNRPSKLSLGLTSPHFLHLFASYYDLNRYRNDEKIWEKLGLPTGISWSDSAAQPAIIRWLAASGSDPIDDPPQVEEEEEYPAEEEYDINDWGDPFREPEVPPPYEETEPYLEDMMVDTIISDWLRARFDVKGGCFHCAGCYRYMLVFGPDGRITPWSKNMLNRRVWIRHCGPCEDSFGIPRGTVLT